MKKLHGVLIIALVSALFFLSSPVYAQNGCTATPSDACSPNIGLQLPAFGAFVNTWNVPVNANMNLLDRLLSGNVNLTALSFSNGVISGNITFGGNLTATGQNAFTLYNLDTILFVDGVKYQTIQATITAACGVSPVSEVVVPSGSYTQNTSLTLCSNLHMQFYPGVTINTTLSSGALFPVTNMNNVVILGYPLISKTGSAGGTAIQCNYCQHSTIQAQVSGNFATGWDIDSNASGSSIYNNFYPDLVTGLAANGSCINITIAGGKVVNDNRFYNPVCGPNTAGGVTAWNDGGGHENSVFGGDLSTGDTTAGKGVVAVAGTRNLLFYGTTIEGNNSGWNPGASSENVSCFGCAIDSNTTNITSRSARSWLQGVVGAVTPTRSLDENGNVQFNGLGIGGATALANGVNLPANGALALAGTNLILSAAPTIAGAGCGGSAASISTNNGTASFDVNVGTAPTSGGCTVTMPSAATRWNCSVNDYTTISTAVFVQKQTASSTNSIVLQNYSDVAVATAPTASDIYHVKCGGE